MCVYSAVVLYTFPLRHPHFFKNKLGKHGLWMCFCFLNGISMGVVHTDQELYTYYYLQIINICVLFPLGWLYMNTEALVLLITKYSVSRFQGCLCEYSLPAAEGTKEAPCWVPPVLLREYMLILSSPLGKAAKGRSRKGSTVFLERVRCQQSEMEEKNAKFVE